MGIGLGGRWLLRRYPPRGSTVLQSGDHVYVLAQQEDKPLIQLMFRRPEAE